MKYVLMYTNRPDLDATLPPGRLDALYQEVYGWFEKFGPAFADGGAELQDPDTATTVKSPAGGESPVVVDGPFSEAKENIGGFSIVDVDHLDAAIAMAKEWPLLKVPGGSVEIRPIIDHSGDM